MLHYWLVLRRLVVFVVDDLLVVCCLLVAPRCAPMLPELFDVLPDVAPPFTDCCNPLLEPSFVLTEVLFDAFLLFVVPDWAKLPVAATTLSKAMVMIVFFIR